MQKPRNLILLEIEVHDSDGQVTDMEPSWVLIDLDAACQIGALAGEKITSSAYFPPEIARQQLTSSTDDTLNRQSTWEAELAKCIDEKRTELDQPGAKDDLTSWIALAQEVQELEAELKHSSSTQPVEATIALEMWYFGCLLYQLCTLDGATLWNSNHADNIVDEKELRQLAYQWPQVKAEKLQAVVWPEARELADILLAEDAKDRPQTWDSVLEHRFLSSQNAQLDRIEARQIRQSSRLEQIAGSTSATFKAIKTHVQGDAAVPTLVTLTRKGAPAWKGAWHDNVKDNTLARVKNAVGSHNFYQLHFLCEKTLLPVAGHPGYELKLSSEGLKKFLHTAGPVLNATCAVLKLVTTVARPLAKVVGLDDYVPSIEGVDLSSVREIECGGTTMGELFDAQFDAVESFGQQ